MRVLVLGAAGGVGRQVVRIGAGRGHDVVGVARDPAGVPTADGVRTVTGDVRDPASWVDLLPGTDAVVWCVGVTPTSGPDVGRASLPALVTAMGQLGVRRFVGISGAGVSLAGDRKGAGARLVSAVTRRLARDLVEDKAGEAAVLGRSSLGWTQVRPPRLVDRPGRGAYRLTAVAPGLVSAPVAKADVALALVDLAASTDHLREAPFLVAGDGRADAR